MKTIAIERTPADTLNLGHFVGQLNHCVADPTGLPTTLIADSAIVRPGTPLFVPGFAENWTLRLAPAIVIGRLGKSIGSRFVSRYISAFRMAARLMPSARQSVAASSASSAQSTCGYAPLSALAATFDGALSLGPEVPLPTGEALSLHVSHPSLRNGEETLTIDVDTLEINNSISHVSHYVMLKTGDIIIPCTLPVEVTPQINTRLVVELNGIEVMNLKVK